MPVEFVTQRVKWALSLHFLGLPKFGVMDVLSCKLIRYSILFFANSLVINNVLYYKL